MRDINVYREINRKRKQEKTYIEQIPSPRHIKTKLSQ